MATRKQRKHSKRRQTQRQRRNHKKKKTQKGGVQFFTHLSSRTNPTIKINVEKSLMTPRTLLQQFIEKEPQMTLHPIFGNWKRNIPAYKLQFSGKAIPSSFSKNEWDAPIHLEEASSIVFLPTPSLAPEFQEQKMIAAIESYIILGRALKYIQKAKGGGLIILESAAIQDFHKKNVNQQFKFSQAISPRILVDWAFFDNTLYLYDFYKYLNFTELHVPGVGPREKVRFYIKKAGDPLEILPPEKEMPDSPYPSSQEKEAYLAQVFEQAKGKDLEAEELFFCCVKHDLSFKSLPIQELNEKLGGSFKVMMWSDDMIEKSNY